MSRLIAAFLMLATGAFVFADAPADLVIEQVTVLPMTAEGDPIRNATVTIRNGRIASIEPGKAPARRDVKRVDGRGKFLMPGFTDMHMHLENDRGMRIFTGDQSIPYGFINLEDVLMPYIANGVTQVFNLSAMSETIGQRVEIESGRVLGPHIATAVMIDGAPPMWPIGISRAAATPEDGRQAVRDALADGYDFIKVYSGLGLETFTAIVDEARKHKVRVLGHIPGRGQNITERFFQPGFDLVSHAEEFAQHTNPPSHEAIPRYVEMAKRNGTWLTATLTLDERLVEQISDPASLTRRPELRYLPPHGYRDVVHDNRYLEDRSEGRIAYIQAVVDFNRALVKAFKEAGIPVLTGTDSLIPGVMPGFSLHDEFQSLANAGMSNRQVLDGTTRLAAEWLGTIGDRGTVEAGKRADLVLLDANPLDDLANTRRIAGVFMNGRYLPRAELDKRLAALAAKNQPH